MLKRIKKMFKNKSGQISNLPMLVKVLISVVLGASVLASMCVVSIDAMSSANNEMSSVFETASNKSENNGNVGEGGDISPLAEPGITYTDRGFVSWDTVVEENPNAFPNSVTCIEGYPGDGGGTSALKNYRKIEKVVFPSSIVEITHWAFNSCTSLTSVTIPNSVTKIGWGAFKSCKSLTNITIPDSVTYIGDEAFADCFDLTSISLSNNLTNIGSLAFYQTAYYDNESNWENNVLYINDYLIAGSHAVDEIEMVEGNYVVKDGTKLIANNAFYNASVKNNLLTSMTIPDSITNIGYQVFYGCSSLKEIRLPNSITNISIYAFARCTSLTDVYYSGTEEQWGKITIDSTNSCLTNATIHYNS